MIRLRNLVVAHLGRSVRGIGLAGMRLGILQDGSDELSLVLRRDGRVAPFAHRNLEGTRRPDVGWIDKSDEPLRKERRPQMSRWNSGPVEDPFSHPMRQGGMAFRDPASGDL